MKTQTKLMLSPQINSPQWLNLRNTALQRLLSFLDKAKKRLLMSSVLTQHCSTAVLLRGVIQIRAMNCKVNERKGNAGKVAR